MAELNITDKRVLTLLRKMARSQISQEEQKTIEEMTKLDLADTGIRSIPTSISHLISLEELNLSLTALTHLPASISSLPNLRRLFLRYTPINTLPKSFENLKTLQEIDLDSTNITSLPPAILHMESLSVLYLSNTKLTKLPDSINELSSLKKLILSRSNLTELPDTIGELQSLEYINLCCTKIRNLPNNFGRLSSLLELNLSRAEIESVPAALEHLSSLQALDLSHTNISALPDFIGELTSLRELNLQGTKITSLPPSIRFLKSLKKLNLIGTRLEKLPEEIGELESLEELCLRETPIMAIPSSLSGLKNLCHLNLIKTQIESFPPGLSFHSLQALYLKGTRINKVPIEIKGLSSLVYLDLRNTSVESIPEWVCDFPKLRGLFISNTLVSKLPMALALGSLPIYNQMRGDFPGIYASGSMLPAVYFSDKAVLTRYLQDSDKQRFGEAKIIFLGDGGAGKTFTINRFLKDGVPEPASPKPNEAYSNGQTHGVKPYDYQTDVDGSPFIIHLWDFGGQEMLHAMHRCFLTENTVYVLMVSTRDSEHTRRLRYWLHCIQPFTRGAEVLVIINTFDGEGSADIDTIGLENEFKSYMKIHFETLSVKDASTETFNRLIRHYLIQKAVMAETITGLHPSVYMLIKNRVKMAIEESRDDAGNERGWISSSDYRLFCDEAGIRDPQEQAALLRYFTDLGICFSTIGMKEAVVSEDCRLIRPVWLTNALYAVIEECKPHRGWVNIEKIQKCLAGEPGEGRSRHYLRVEPEMRYNSEDCAYMMHVAQRYSLAYLDPEDREEIFFPSMCSYADKRPDDLQLPTQAAYSLTYEVEFPYLSETVVQRLMLDCLVEGYQRPECWRGGFRFTQGPCSGIVDTVEDDKVLRLELWSDNAESPVLDKLQWFKEHIGRSAQYLSGPKEYIVVETERYSLRRLLHARHLNITRVPKESDENSAFTVSELIGAFPVSQDESKSITYNYNNYGPGYQNINTASGGIAIQNNKQENRETDLSWECFAYNYRNTPIEFEHLCTDLFRLEYFSRDTVFQSVLNNPGLECHPQIAKKGEYEGKLIGFQAKYFVSKPGPTQMDEIKKTMEKALQFYHQDHTPGKAIEVIVLYCNTPLSRRDANDGPKGNKILAASEAMLKDAGVDLQVITSHELLQRIQIYPELVKRYFYCK